MPLTVHRNQLQECSGFLQEALDLKGLTMERDAEAVRAIGLQVLNLMLPQLEHVYKRPTGISADLVLAKNDDEMRRYNKARFIGNFSHIRIAELVHTEEDDILGVLETERVDVLLAFTPAIVEPDPVDLIFSREVVIPLSEIERIDQVA